MRELLVELLIFIVQFDVAIELVKGVNAVDSSDDAAHQWPSLGDRSGGPPSALF